MNATSNNKNGRSLSALLDVNTMTISPSPLSAEELDLKLQQWKDLDPATQEADWIQLGLELGTNTANEARNAAHRTLASRIGMKIFGFVAKLASLGRAGKEIKTPDVQQIPWLNIWPKLRGQPFHSPSVLTNSELVQNEWAEIQKELENLIVSEEGGFERAIYDGFGGVPWKTCYFELFGQRNKRLHELCPKTSALLATLPDNHMHTCFSCIEPGATLPPHVGPSNAWLVGHLGILNCEDTHIFSGLTHKRFKTGEWLILDDSYVHGVVNRGTKPRFTLMVTFHHPDLGGFELFVIKSLMKFVGLIMAPLFRDEKIALHVYE